MSYLWAVDWSSFPLVVLELLSSGSFCFAYCFQAVLALQLLCELHSDLSLCLTVDALLIRLILLGPRLWHPLHQIEQQLAYGPGQRPKCNGCSPSKVKKNLNRPFLAVLHLFGYSVFAVNFCEMYCPLYSNFFIGPKEHQYWIRVGLPKASKSNWPCALHNVFLT